jgi:hypothetical protein
MKQITEDYCNKDISVMLKEKGFDVPVKNYFSLNKDAMLHNLDKKYGAKKNWNAFEICISRPSQSLALKWLSEVHNLYIEIRRNLNTFYYGWKVEQGMSEKVVFDYKYDSYEQAVEAALKYTLENLI